MHQSENPLSTDQYQHSKRVAVLLSACIIPNVGMEARQDPVARMHQYGQAFSKWTVAGGFSGLVFCENSGADLSEFESVARARSSSQCEMEFLSFKGSGYDSALGKGYGEMEIIRHAMNASKIVDNADLVIKVTGRIFVRNIKRLGESLVSASGVSVYCDLRKNLMSSDSRVFCATPGFIRNYLLPRAGLLNDSKGVFFEHVLAGAAHAAMADGWIWAPMPKAHWMEGVTGAADEPIQSSWVSQLKRECFRVIKDVCLKR